MQKEQAARRERERALRAEQDRAFEDSRRKDMERRMQREEEERRAVVEKREREEEERREKERAEREERERKESEERRMAWRRWERRVLILREPRPGEGRSPVRGGSSPPGNVNGNGNGRGRTLRIGVRMPDGRRAIRFFGETDGLIALFAFVDSLFIPAHLSSDDDPLSPPSSPSLAPPSPGQGEELVLSEMRRLQVSQVPEEWWGFKLWLQYPRREIAYEAGRRIGDVDVLKGGGQLVVEVFPDAGTAKAKARSAASDSNGADSDGYETESD